MENQDKNQIDDAKKNAQKVLNGRTKSDHKGIDAESIGNIRMISGRFSSDIRIVPEVATTPPSATMYGLSMVPSTSNSGIARNLISTVRAPVMVQTAKFKFLILGAAFVGKTSLLRRLQDPFYCLPDKNYVPSNGPDLYRLHCGTIEAIDIGGLEQCRPIACLYCDLFDSFMVVFDVTNTDSFEAARDWLEFLRNRPKDLLKDDNSPLKLLLVGNKTDITEKRKIPANLAKNLAMVYEAKYFEVSARYDLTLDPVIEFLNS